MVKMNPKKIRRMSAILIILSILIVLLFIVSIFWSTTVLALIYVVSEETEQHISVGFGDAHFIYTIFPWLITIGVNATLITLSKKFGQKFYAEGFRIFSIVSLIVVAVAMCIFIGLLFILYS